MQTLRWVVVAGVGVLGAAQDPTATAPWADPHPGLPDLRAFHIEVFRKFQVDYLRIASYADPAALARRPAGTGALDWVLAGKVACGRRSRVLHAISAARRFEGVVRQLADHWPRPGFDAAHPAVKAYLAAVARPLARGAELAYLYDPAGKVHLRHGDEPWTTVADPDLHRALLRVAFQRADPGEATALARDLEALASAGRAR